MIYDTSRVGQNHIYIRCVYGVFGRELTKCTVTYGVYIWFWPAPDTSNPASDLCGLELAV